MPKFEFHTTEGIKVYEGETWGDAVMMNGGGTGTLNRTNAIYEIMETGELKLIPVTPNGKTANNII